MKQKKEQNLKNLEKKKYSDQLKSPTKSPTYKQNDNSDTSLQLLQTKSNKSKTLLDDISQDDEDTFGPNVTDALA